MRKVEIEKFCAFYSRAWETWSYLASPRYFSGRLLDTFNTNQGLWICARRIFHAKSRRNPREPWSTRPRPARVLVRFEFIITSRTRISVPNPSTACAPRVIPTEIQFVIRPCARYFIMCRRRKKSRWDAQTFSSSGAKGESISGASFIYLSGLQIQNAKEEKPFISMIETWWMLLEL